MKILICKNCGDEFSPKNRNYKQECCSRSCGQILAIKLGHKPKLFQKDKPSWNKGLKISGMSNKKHSKKTKEKMRLAHQGEKSSAWKGGVSSKNQLLRKSSRFKEWRKAVYERDDYTCQKCWRRSKRGKRIILHPHHIKSLAEYPELAYEVDNGLTVYSDCHQEIHKDIMLSVK